ncbi:hypothetical protein BV22DRAFT_1102698 [Leucogyrophana mollusca]|uniref:Uncharacterized protein n=1 Tax=Leucogyrophana mollusca TaxID=85980 RepID=A0ACB8BU50_9AGAM|nr:hypothetical protein BV22DRAFT_1102698 [Leucogyrophana mollusca]
MSCLWYSAPTPQYFNFVISPRLAACLPHDPVSSGGESVGPEDESDDVKSLHSDALDEDSDAFVKGTARDKKRRRPTKAKMKAATPVKSSSPKKTPARKRRKVEDEAQTGEDDAEFDVKDGQEVVGVVVQAPKTGWVPAGQVSQNTLDFLKNLKDPACNDRECSLASVLHPEPIYRRAEVEFKAFIDSFTEVLTEVDSQIPPLPPKDVIHRIYRDIRFSNDKTPYKTGFSASFSRSGRKGLFAFLKPGGESMFAAGAWCPGKNELATLRSHIQRSSRRLRDIISGPDFVAYFGEPRPHPRGQRQNVFGHDDELKVAPKGIDKNHKDIDLLKCRTLAVSCRFTDEQVLSPTFNEELRKVAQIVQPLVHWCGIHGQWPVFSGSHMISLNDMMTLPVEDDSDGDSEEAEEVGE